MATRGADYRAADEIGRSSVTPGARHEGFLRYRKMFWGKVALIISLIVIIAYLLIDVEPRPNGGSWYGYLLGTIGVLLILWLTMLGVRKRAMTSGRWSLKAWTSAHVYLGLSLVVIGTLHTGFQLGWNVHTLAWALMMIVIVSGLFGITSYVTLPRKLGSNRDEATEGQMLEAVTDLDSQLFQTAQPLDGEAAAEIRAAIEEDAFGAGVWRRLTGRYRGGATTDALADFRARTRDGNDPLHDTYNRLEAQLSRKQAALSRIRRHLRYKALLQIWLYIHVPLTFALLAALSAHIVSVFFYW